MVVDSRRHNINYLEISLKYMLFDILFLVAGSIFKILFGLFPTWTIWPDSVIDGVSFVVATIAKLNFFLPGVISTMFDCLAFFINFLGYFLTYLIIKKIFNWFRGAEGI